MKYIFGVWIIFFPLLAYEQKDSNINFDHLRSWGQILDRAQNERKLILIDVFATWCGPCKMMENTVFTDSSLRQQINSNFIAIKVQLDSTASDDYYVKSWYCEAEKIRRVYKIDRLPAFLFITPDGHLVYKDVGFKNVKEFMDMDSLVLEPDHIQLYSRYDQYKRGVIVNSELGKLAVFTKTIIGDQDLADQMAREYKVNYLDKLSADALLKVRYFNFMVKFPNLFTTTDAFFELLYNQPIRVDSIMGSGWSDSFVKWLISKDYIDKRVTRNGRPIQKKVKWKRIVREIQQKYLHLDATKLVWDYEAVYYRITDTNWQKWAKARNNILINYPPHPGAFTAISLLNNPAWDIFLNCNNKNVLKSALKWCDEGLKMLETDTQYKYIILDTKANILYKLKRFNEAIYEEEAAVAVSKRIAQIEGVEKGPNFDEITKALCEMKERRPTYLKQGAIWDEKTLPNKRNG